MTVSLYHDPETGEILETSASGNIAEFSVSEISQALKRTLEENFSYVRIRGEISGYRGPHSSGHCYFALKDVNAKIEAVIWRGGFGRLRSVLQEGLEVVATGKITSFPGKSSYQIVIEAIEPAGIGALMALLEARKKKLSEEGLFDTQRKKPIPYLPKIIGVITSPTGAVIRDILHRLADRFPRHVLIWPVRVQGEGSAQEIVEAIAGFNALEKDGIPQRPDILIVARGGGSLEDLWGFNEESVVRAAAASIIPLISAIGHEADWTLLDLVADQRAPTPTAAAEKAVPVRLDLIAKITSIEARQERARLRIFSEYRNRLDVAKLRFLQISRWLGPSAQRLDSASLRLVQSLRLNIAHHRALLDRLSPQLKPAALSLRLQLCRSMLDSLAGRSRRGLLLIARRLRQTLDAEAKILASLSYKSVLARGFLIARNEEDGFIRYANQVKTAQYLILEFSDGKVRVKEDHVDL